MLKHAERGSAIIEMAFIIPLLLILVLGLVEAGRLGDYAIHVANAARAGVQYGAQNEATAGDTQGMQNAANADAQYAGITSVAAPTFCTCADGTPSTCQQGDCPGSHRLQWVKVTATGTFTSINSTLVPASLRNVTLTRTAIMEVAQ